MFSAKLSFNKLLGIKSRNVYTSLSNKFYSVAASSHPEMDEALLMLHPALIKRADEISQELSDLEKKVSDGNSFNIEYQKKLSDLATIQDSYLKYKSLQNDYNELQQLIEEPEQEPELVKEANIELADLRPSLAQLISELKTKLLPPHPFDSKACILELRPGVGGDEATIFTKDLFDMYVNFAKVKRWPYHVISEAKTEGNNGLTSGAVSIDEPGSYRLLKFEKGVHRVQRVPATETKGRVHTSTAAVIILPKISDENENPDADQREFKPDEIRIDVMRSRGKGGQHVNTTDSAVRLTHYPSGIVVSMQDERSQHKNKAKAFAILRARLAEKERSEKAEKERSLRTSQVTTTDRSDKIRTYNYPQNRITDHRCGFTLHDIDNCMNGTKLEDLITVVEKNYNDERAKELELQVDWLCGVNMYIVVLKII